MADNASTLSALQAKYDALRAYIADLGSVLVAFSGGIDSMLLLKVAHEALGERAVAATVRSCFTPKREIEEAVDFCAEEEIEHVIIDIDPLSIEGVAANPLNRCYLCKQAIMGELVAKAAEMGLDHVVEGSNVDDEGGFRPGKQAIGELGIVSPLLASGFSKDDIRLLALSLGIENWDKPSSACLASRVPYGDELNAEKLACIEAAEQLLHDGGFEQKRVRVHGDLARIEVMRDELADLLEFSERENLVGKLRELGFSFVTLDLEGFRSGSFDKAL